MLHRFSEQFPTLEVTAIAPTLGNFSNLVFSAPRAEADELQRWWLGFHRLPGMLAITTTSFFWSPGLEHRRIDEITQNDVNYTFGANTSVISTTFFLVDTDGEIISSGLMTRDREHELRDLMAIMTRRGN